MTTLLKVDGASASQSVWKQVLDVFKKGGIIAYPTETFYGLGVDPFNETAVKKLFNLKGREADKPISILVKDKKMLAEVAEEIPLSAEKLIKKFWPGPLTIILKAKKSIPITLRAGTGTIAVRISSNTITQKLLEAIDSPITTTSANPSGKKSPVTASEVMNYFKNKVDLILDGGVLSGKLGSTIVDVTEGDVNINIAKELEKLIIQRVDAIVLLTRTDDTFVSLDERTNVANKNNADIFISIHANASYRKGAGGVETYFLSFDASDEDAKRAAAFENAVASFENKAVKTN